MNIFGIAGLVTTLAASVAVFGAYRRQLNRAQQRVRAGGKIAETKLGPIEYGVAGSGAPALVIHGAGGGYGQGLLYRTKLSAIPGNCTFAVWISPNAGARESLICDAGGRPRGFAR